MVRFLRRRKHFIRGADDIIKDEYIIKKKKKVIAYTSKAQKNCNYMF